MNLITGKGELDLAREWKRVHVRQKRAKPSGEVTRREREIAAHRWRQNCTKIWKQRPQSILQKKRPHPESGDRKLFGIILTRRQSHQQTETLGAGNLREPTLFVSRRRNKFTPENPCSDLRRVCKIWRHLKKIGRIGYFCRHARRQSMRGDLSYRHDPVYWL